jgi:hypothetical protein
MDSLIPIGIDEFVLMSDIDAVLLFGIVFANELLHLKKACVTVEYHSNCIRVVGKERERDTINGPLQ